MLPRKYLRKLDTRKAAYESWDFMARLLGFAVEFGYRSCTRNLTHDRLQKDLSLTPN